MIVYSIQPIDDGWWVLAQNDDDLERICASSEPLLPNWKPLEARLLTEGEGKSFVEVDMPWMAGAALVVNNQAKRALEDVVGVEAEFLPVNVADKKFWILNAFQLPDALDEAGSEILRFPSSGRVMKVLQFAFNAGAVSDRTIFKIPQLSRSATFVTEKFVAAVIAAGLSGFQFTEIWASSV
ncbi:MAG: hypothetical protein EVA65_04715 [Oceanococcus sp.]|nr:MAG: hypothetical protein EVA65_04715 [Oceanococcus sp.]